MIVSKVFYVLSTMLAWNHKNSSHQINPICLPNLLLEFRRKLVRLVFGTTTSMAWSRMIRILCCVEPFCSLKSFLTARLRPILNSTTLLFTISTFTAPPSYGVHGIYHPPWICLIQVELKKICCLTETPFPPMQFGCFFLLFSHFEQEVNIF